MRKMRFSSKVPSRIRFNARDESIYRRGFAAALLPFVRGRGYDQALGDLHRLYPDVCEADAFRSGFDRGHAWAEEQRRGDRAAA